MRYARACFFVCLLLFAAPRAANADAASDRAALQAQLDQINSEIQKNQVNLSAAQAERTSLERDVAVLDYKIQQAQLQIKQTDLTLRQLQGDIAARQSDITSVDAQVVAGQESLAQILRHTREIDDVPFAQRALESSFSDLFREIGDFEVVQRALGQSFTQMSVLRSDLSARKQALEDKQIEIQQVRGAQVIAKETIQNDEKKKQNLLSITKGQEALYQQLIAGKQQQAAQIRAQLFGLRDTSAISFGVAYDYAKQASAATGVSSALILAILTQESNLGGNVGSCFVSSLSTGSGVRKNGSRSYSNVMKAPRDTGPFQTITQTLGIPWATTAVSCPQGSGGYGGAMGPAQFIPSTWVLYQDRLASITSEPFPDPWNPRTAVFATALLMKDNGADGGTRAAERKAALKYFAGANWYKAANAPYGDSVMDLRDSIQSQIDVLAG